MKIHSVQMRGFGPFRDTQIIDFDRFCDDGMFVITGRTGAGKSTVLDAITFALFGHIPRYGAATDDRVRSKFLEDSDEPTHVVVVFSQGDRTYRVTRTPSYFTPGRKTPHQHTAEIAQIVDGVEQVLDARLVRNVSARISEIVGLNAEQFMQVAVLAQGDFQRFLLADSKDRRALLGKIFATDRFARYTALLSERAERAKKLQSRSGDRLAMVAESMARRGEVDPPATLTANELVPWAASLLEQFADRHRQARSAVGQATTKAQHAERELQQAEAIVVRQRRRAEAEAEAARLAAEASVIEDDQTALKSASLALEIVDVLRNHDDAVAEADAAEAALHNSATTYRDLLTGEESEEELLARERSLTEELTRLADVVSIERSLVQRQAAASDAEKQLAAAKEQKSSLASRVGALRHDVAQHEAEIAANEVEGADVVEAAQLVELWAERLEELRRSEALERDLQQARAEHLAAQDAVVTAEDEVRSLLARRYAQHAAQLAEQLKDGEPCAVCGATTHPQPARATTELVSEEAFDRATSTAQEARTAAIDCGAAVAVIETRLAEAQRRAGADPQLIEARHAEQVTRYQELRERHDRKKAVIDEAARTRETIEELTTQLSELDLAIAKDETKLVTQLDDIERDVDLCAAARGGHESVEDHHRALESTRQAVASHAGLTRSQVAAVARRKEAASRLAERLEQVGFDTADQARAAIVPTSQMDVMKARIRDHHDKLAAVGAELASEELANLPTDDIDVDTPREVARQTREALAQATEQAGALAALLADLERDREQISALVEGLQSAQEEHDRLIELAEIAKGKDPNIRKMSWETFALAADLEEIIKAANLILGRMTSQRYELIHTDERAKGNSQSGLGIDIFDAYNGERRTPQSLSGGEKFQASLALALGLAEVVTERNGGVRLDTLFVDEGFGSLDADTLQEVLDTLETLREGGRTVGLISHVDDVKERISGHIEIVADPDGPSHIRR